MTQEQLEGNKVIAVFDGYYIHNNVYVQDYGTFHGEPDPESRLTTVYSKHKTLKYKDCDAPSHWNLPKVVDGYKTPIIEELKYHSSWDWLIPACKKFCDFLPIRFKNQTERGQYIYLCNMIRYMVGVYNIDSAFAALVKGIKWYQNLKK